MKVVPQTWIGAVAIVLALTTGCAWGTLTPEEFEARQISGVCGEFFQPNGLTPTFAAIGEEVGRPIRVTEMTVYPDYAVLELRDPVNARHLNRWVVRGVDVEPPTPEQVSANDDLDARTFRLGDFPWSDLNRALDQGLSSLNLESGTIRYITVGLRDGSLQMQAYYGGPRESGSVDFDGALTIINSRRN